MKGDYWCWYDWAQEWWGIWGTGACLMECNDFLWHS